MPCTTRSRTIPTVSADLLPFSPFALESREALLPILNSQPYRICDHSFPNLYIWQMHNRIRYCLEDGILYLTYAFGSHGETYHFPLGAQGRLPLAIDRLRRDAAARGVPFRLSLLNAGMREELETVMPGCFLFTERRDEADYIYDAQSLITLRGKKLHGKRNFINRFQSMYEGRFTLDDITEDNLCEVMRFNNEWRRKNAHADGEDLLREAQSIRIALANFHELGLSGIALRLDGEIIAYAIGAPLSDDTFHEMIEKADGEIPGAYQMINRAFAARFCEGYAYINREEDLGIEGLRQAKLSYYPAYINMRYDAHPVKTADGGGAGSGA